MAAFALGIMTRHVERDSLAEVAAAIAGYGLTAVQLTLESAGLEPIPAALDRHTAQRIGTTLRDAGLTVAAVSGTFNVLDPDLARRRDYLDRFARLCDALPWLGASVVTTCTGTRDPHSMWAPHPANDDTGGVGRACRADGHNGRDGRPRRRDHGVRAGNGQRGEQPGQSAASPGDDQLAAPGHNPRSGELLPARRPAPHERGAPQTGYGAWGRP